MLQFCHNLTKLQNIQGFFFFCLIAEFDLVRLCFMYVLNSDTVERGGEMRGEVRFTWCLTHVLTSSSAARWPWAKSNKWCVFFSPDSEYLCSSCVHRCTLILHILLSQILYIWRVSHWGMKYRQEVASVWCRQTDRWGVCLSYKLPRHFTSFFSFRLCLNLCRRNWEGSMSVTLYPTDNSTEPRNRGAVVSWL